MYEIYTSKKGHWHWVSCQNTFCMLQPLPSVLEILRDRLWLLWAERLLIHLQTCHVPSSDGYVTWSDLHQTCDEETKIFVNARGTSSHWTRDNMACSPNIGCYMTSLWCNIFHPALKPCGVKLVSLSGIDKEVKHNAILWLYCPEYDETRTSEQLNDWAKAQLSKR